MTPRALRTEDGQDTEMAEMIQDEVIRLERQLETA